MKCIPSRARARSLVEMVVKPVVAETGTDFLRSTGTPISSPARLIMLVCVNVLMNSYVYHDVQ